MAGRQFSGPAPQYRHRTSGCCVLDQSRIARVARQQLALTGAPLRRSWSPQARYIALGWRLHELNSRLDTLERQRRMAKVRWRGESFDARPISQNPDGSWLMEAQEHTSRTAPGTRITALASEIVAGTMPGEANATPAAPRWPKSARHCPIPPR